MSHKKRRAVSVKELCKLLGSDVDAIQDIIYNKNLFYCTRKIDKSDGSERILTIPNKKLKLIQKTILKEILSDTKPPPYVFGLDHKGIDDNARLHSKSDYLLNLDIKNFFPSVHYSKIESIFEYLRFNTEQRRLLTELTTTDYCLPQGAPTSPFLASRALLELDRRLFSLCRNHGIKYTRYFDDLSFSGNDRVLKIEKKIIEIIKSYNYETKQEKRRLFGPGETKEVTGVLITKKGLRLRKSEELKNYLTDLVEYGLEKLKSDNPEKERRSLLGKIAIVKKINESQGKNFLGIFKNIIWD